MLHLADHIRPLLRDHDCVIIPDFGGLVADVSAARAQPGRQSLSPPTKLVAFNQALTRNDGLLVDALSEHLGLTIAQARETVRTAVAGLQRELDETNRTELPGIGIFRRAVGRGLAFEYTGTDNLLASAFGLPELAARPVRANDARLKRPQPALRGTATRRSRWTKLLPAGAIAMAAGLFLMANYQVVSLSGNWRSQLPKWEWAPRPATAVVLTEPQQATLGQHDFTAAPDAAEGMTPVGTPVSIPEMAPSASAPVIEPVTAEVTSAPTKPAPAVILPAKPTETVSTNAAVAKAASTVAAPAAPKASTKVNTPTIKFRTGRYYVIAGAYRNLSGAEKGRKLLVRTGHASRIILPPYGSRLYRLTAADYPDLASAQREAQRLRVSTRCDYNTLKF